ncbi:MAG TPA: alpha/beta hydrolase [Caulobacteraceae bacterium]|nr:alpha/beta hydrolase [Caulobacteraceae bacterium]
MHARLLAATFCVALLVAGAASAAAFTAGERHLKTATASAAARNHGDGTIRITLWYPSTAKEGTSLDVGPPGRPLFVTGSVAADAPFADDKRRALVLVSHGFGGSARSMAWFGTALARVGYVVVAVDHPGTNGVEGVTAEGAYAPWERPRDLQAALDKVLADPALAAHIDKDRIGVAGFSLGGFTSLLELGARPDFDQFLAFCNGPKRDAICDPQIEYPVDMRKQAGVLAEPGMATVDADRKADLADPRVKAAFTIAPAVIQAIDFDSLRKIKKPVAIALGDSDTVAPPATNGELAAKLVPGATIDVLPGVGHYTFLPDCGPGSAVLPAAYCSERPGVSRDAAHDRVTGEAIAFFDKTLRR